MTLRRLNLQPARSYQALESSIFSRSLSPRELESLMVPIKKYRSKNKGKVKRKTKGRP